MLPNKCMFLLYNMHKTFTYISNNCRVGDVLDDGEPDGSGSTQLRQAPLSAQQVLTSIYPDLTTHIKK